MKTLLSAICLMAFTGSAAGIFSTAVRAYQSSAYSAGAQSANIQVINVSAKKYAFNPAVIHVKEGARVVLHITATDHEHGFRLSADPAGASPKGTPGLDFAAPQSCWMLPKGKTVTIEFIARTPGHYPFKCCKYCGLGHKHMKGEIIVEE